MARLITLFRKADNPVDWDFYISESTEEAEATVTNLTARGVRQFTTYPLGDKLPDLSRSPDT